MELTKTLNLILVKVSLKNLTIGELNPTATFLRVMTQHALVVLPVILQVVEVGVVEATLERDWIVVIDFPESIELVLGPLPFVG